MVEVSLCVECGLQVSVVFPDPVCRHGACTPRLGDWQIDWLSRYHFAQGPGGLVFVRIGGSGVCGFFLDLIGLQMVWSSHLDEAMYAAKVALLISRRLMNE